MKNLEDNKYKVLQPFSIRVGSHTRNPNGIDNINLLAGDIIYHDGDSDDGHVWFYSKLPKNTFDYMYRGFTMSGEINNLIRHGMIEQEK